MPSGWIFDELPPSGARRGGDPAPHAFRQNLGTFVREVIQNSSDQAVAEGAMEIHFDFIELQAEQLGLFQRSVGWKALDAHLRAAATEAGGRELKRFLSEFDTRKTLMLLRVEDRNTVGLTGKELEGDSHFRALCKDTLYSHKQGEGAGGSYGLGKSVLWAFSGLSTVMFNSTLTTHPDQRESPRLIGRAELPSHSVAAGKAARWFAGPGWFGDVVALDGGHQRAESVWGASAELIANAMYCGRGQETGTSLLIVGFRDPTSDADASEQELSSSLCQEIVKHFWPALMMPGRKLTAFVGTEAIQAADLADVRAFCECFSRRDSATPSLENEGDVVMREIPIVVPERIDGTKAVKGTVRLIVRLAEEGSADGRIGHVALFRRPGMVLKYLNRQRIAVGVRPFHAVLACGLARDPEAPTAEDHAVEHFLRSAEPPGHDEWQTTATLKATYKRGYAKAITDLNNKVQEELRKLVVSQPKHGTKGPERLMKRFPIGAKGGKKTGAKHAFHFPELDARFDGTRWCVQGTVLPAHVDGAWACRIELTEVDEDGGSRLCVSPEDVSSTTADVTSTREEDCAILRASGTAPVVFSIRSTPFTSGAEGRGQLHVEVTGWQVSA